MTVQRLAEILGAFHIVDHRASVGIRMEGTLTMLCVSAGRIKVPDPLSPSKLAQDFVVRLTEDGWRWNTKNYWWEIVLEGPEGKFFTDDTVSP